MLNRLITLLFVPAAVALGHALGYAVAHPGGAMSSEVLARHPDLSTFTAVGLCSGAAAVAITWRERSRGRTLTPRVTTLVRAAVLGFSVVETVERARVGQVDGLLADPALWWGIAMQVVAAGFLVALARATLLIATWRERRGVRVRLMTDRPRPALTPLHAASADRCVVTATRRRGPPLLA